MNKSQLSEEMVIPVTKKMGRDEHPEVGRGTRGKTTLRSTSSKIEMEGLAGQLDI